MSSMYSLKKLSGGWAVVMTANRRIMEIQPTEAKANEMLSLYTAGERTSANKPPVIIVDGFVCEANGYEAGIQIGEVHEIDLKQYEVVRTMSQEDFDEEAEEYFRENGHYPDQ